MAESLVWRKAGSTAALMAAWKAVRKGVTMVVSMADLKAACSVEWTAAYLVESWVVKMAGSMAEQKAVLTAEYSVVWSAKSLAELRAAS